MIFRAPEPPVVIPDVALTPFLLEHAEERGDKPAFVDGPSGRTLTYRGWAESVRRTAAGLAARGFRKGDVFAIYSPNVPEYAVAFHAVSLLGGINTTISPALHCHRVERPAQGLRGALPCDGASRVPRRRSRRRGSPACARCSCSARPNAARPSDRCSLPKARLPPSRSIHARISSCIPYSSGTTGLPKGVMLTHYNLVANILQTAGPLGLREDDIMLGVLPFFHIYGMTVIMNLALHVGATVVTMPRFDLEQCLQILEKYRVTFANVVPPMVLAFAKSPLVDKYDLSRLRTVFSGAAPLKEDLAEAARARLGCSVVQGYGLTETSPVTHATRAGGDRISLASIGPPVPNTEVKVVDVVSQAELGPNEEGEICVRGPQVMKGYLNRPDATAAMIDADGWLHTGDIGFADERGCFFIVDRLKELIKYKGMQIAPAELEAVLLGHPSIADAAVIPLADEEAGQVPKAFVVLKGELTPTDILAYVAARVAPYKKLRSVEVTDHIPKSPSGKILRRILVERQRST